MKLWYGYSSEHSSRIKLIGRFKTSAAGKEFEESLNQMRELVVENYDECLNNVDKFPRHILDLLFHGAIKNTQTLAAHDLLDFGNEMSVDLKDKEIVISSDECNWAGVIKMLIEAGAKIEMFSEHDYPVQDED